jgi:imidazolonepropionase-like amidohydrolase
MRPSKTSLAFGIVACALLACAGSRAAQDSATPAPDVPPDTLIHVRGSDDAAGAMTNGEQIEIVSRLLRSSYYPPDRQARWLDPRPLSNVRVGTADDTVGTDSDYADDVITATRISRVCVLGGRDFACRGKAGGVVRLSWPYRIAKDTAVIFAVFTPRDSLGKLGIPRPEMRFTIVHRGSEGWDLDERGKVVPGQQARRSATVFISNVNVVDMRAGRVLPRQNVLIEGTRIAYVGVADTNPGPSARRVDGRGKYLIPGLWDMHVHTAIIGGRELLSLYVANGVLGVRDMAGEWPTLTGWRREIAAGTLVGPRIVASGPYLEGGDVPIPHILTTNPAEGIAGVDSLIKLGVDFVKVHGQLRPETYHAIARRARERRIDFSGHVSQAVGAANASDSGQKSLEHLLGIPAPCTPAESLSLRPRYPLQTAIGRCRSTNMAELYARFVRNKTWVTPTFVAAVEIASWPDRRLPGDRFAEYLPDSVKRFVLQMFPMPDSIPRGADEIGRAMLNKRMRQVADMHRAGVDILTGTDAPLRNSPPGFGMHEEMLLLVRGGMTPYEALRAATLAPARFLNATDSMGTVEKGKLADLVLLDADPLLDISNTRRITAVIANGRYYGSVERERLLRCCSKRDR